MSPDEKALLDAAKDGDAAAVKQCLRQTDMNCTLDLGDDDDDDLMNGSTSLHFACANGGMAVSQLLLDNGADANLANNYGRRPMDCAAENGHLDLVPLLLRNGADPNEGVGPTGEGPLYSAAENAYNGLDALAYATLLIENKADVNKIGCTETALHEAVRSGEVGVVNLLIASDADVNIAGLEHGGTALHMALYHGAAYGGGADMVSLLLQGGGDRDATDGQGKTAADIANESGLEDALALLR